MYLESLFLNRTGFCILALAIAPKFLSHNTWCFPTKFWFSLLVETHGVIQLQITIYLVLPILLLTQTNLLCALKLRHQFWLRELTFSGPSGQIFSASSAISLKMHLLLLRTLCSRHSIAFLGTSLVRNLQVSLGQTASASLMIMIHEQTFRQKFQLLFYL